MPYNSTDPLVIYITTRKANADDLHALDSDKTFIEIF